LPVIPGEPEPPAQLAQLPRLRVRGHSGPGPVDLGGDIRKAAGDPRRFGSCRGHLSQPLGLAGVGGEPESFVERGGAVTAAPRGEHAGDGQGGDLRDRRQVRAPHGVGQVLLRPGVLALLTQ
jgi:hypothetical protein